MSRRAACTALATLAAACATRTASRAAEPPGETAAVEDWTAYKDRFFRDDGRIVDTYTGLSHTESQGTGMLFALEAGDRAAFERIWAFTRAHMRRPDGLFSWRFDPAAAVPVSDPNNASDGDLLIAWALARAGRAFAEPALAGEAATLAQTIAASLIHGPPGRSLLKPAVAHFDRPDGLVVNLSYYVFPALLELAEMAPALGALAQDGVSLIEAARFGAHGLPPDWAVVSDDGAVRIWAERPARFGYEAIRVPLYLIWAGLDTPARLAPYASAWAGLDEPAPPPSWIDLNTGEAAPYPASNGFLAVRRLVEGRLGRAAPPIAPSPQDDYYAMSLILFARMASRR